MIIECPKCKSTFNVADSIEKKNFSNFKCSICQYIWKVKAQYKKPSSDKKNRKKNNYSYVLILNLVILLLAVLALILFLVIKHVQPIICYIMFQKFICEK